MSETPLSDSVVECRKAIHILMEMRQYWVDTQQKASASQRQYEAQLDVVDQAWSNLLDLAMGYERGE